MKRLFMLASLVCVFTGLGGRAFGAADPLAPLGSIPVQDGGRVKPLDTLARESLELVYGKFTYEQKSALEIVFTWLLQPNAWEEKNFIQVTDFNLRKSLKLDEGRVYFSPREIMGSERLATLFQDLQARRERKEKLDAYYTALSRLEHQLYVFREVAAGRFFRMVPPKPQPEGSPAPMASGMMPSKGDAWIALPDMTENFQDAFKEIAGNFVEVIARRVEDKPIDEALTAKVASSVEAFKTLARNENPALVDVKKVETELHYNSFRPFKIAWISYLIATVLLGLGWAGLVRWGYQLGWGAALIGLALHVYGFSVRIYLMGRPPVSNMYETVVWVAFGGLVVAMVLEVVYRWRILLLAGTLLATFTLILTDYAPLVLDPSLDPLEPVLRDNFWLLVHVLTITISYAPLFLAFVLGDMALVYFLKGEEKHREVLRGLTLAQYRGIQIGVALLAPGIILGGVWADYSWGRFWGWDPKETWALIALLGYLAVLHARIAGYVQQFGMAVASVLSFNLVIMAWYGVNFVLGAGLHTYGFGAGGVEYVFTFCALQVLFVVFVWRFRKSRSAQRS